MKTLLFTALLFFTGICYPQEDITMKDNGNTRGVKEKYFQDFLNFKSDQPGKTRLDVFISVPYAEVQFIKNTEGFQAGYSATVSVFTEDKEKLILEKTWNEKLTVREFNQTVAPANYSLTMRSFLLEPGKYSIRTEIMDQDSRKSSVSENTYTIRNLAANPSVSDIMFIASRAGGTGRGLKIIPDVDRNIEVSKEGMQIFYEVYADSAASYNIEYLIKDNDQKVLQTINKTKSVSPGKAQIFDTLKLADLGMGNYLLVTNLKDAKSATVASTIKSFHSQWQGVPLSVKDLDEAIAQMVYIATSTELDSIEDAPTKEEKIKQFRNFWLKKDPNPATEENEVENEYFRRVDFANKNFSNYTAGWKSDRGMVYIILGPPNNVDRHPFEYDTKPYEVWQYYNLNQQFVFQDLTGFGDYRLLNPLYGDLFRYRP